MTTTPPPPPPKKKKVWFRKKLWCRIGGEINHENVCQGQVTELKYDADVSRVK